ncbi:MAG: four helix bundle protein [Armatimonadetes bacterium]|nr:four helix bundle protein [Armatimonadota bacterium]
MNEEQLKTKTRHIALETIKLVESMPRGKSADAIGRQLVRSATSVGANYRAACRSRSRTEFLARLGVVEEEVDESIYWLELIVDAGLVPHARVKAVITECEEILRIIVSSIKTVRDKKPLGTNAKNPKSQIQNPK